MHTVPSVREIREIVLRRDLARERKVRPETLRRHEKIGLLPPSRRFGPRLRGWYRDELDVFFAQHQPIAEEV
ncbi:MAG: hypothetical protein ACREQ4_09555 [Candidatus Binataceae bacterium]